VSFDAVRRLREMTNEELGVWGERFWPLVFEDADLSYIPLHKICDRGAPKQRGAAETILPDFEVSNHRFAVYADSKVKREPAFYRHAGEIRHGIERRHWENYAAFAGMHGKSCCLALFECFKDKKSMEWSGSLLLQTLVRLGQPFDGLGSLKSMVFWPRTRFEEVGTISPNGLVDLFNRHECRPRFKERIWEVLELTVQENKQRMMF
jgi:hypothetical protein